MKPSVSPRYGNARIYSGEPHPEGDKVLVVNGFSESITHSKPLVRALAKLGYNALTFSPPRNSAKEKPVDPIELQSKVIQEMLGSLSEGESIDVVAHSLGAAAVLRAAQVMPERFKSITLLEPVGMIDEDQPILELAQRAGIKVVNNQVGTLRGEDEFTSAKPETAIGLTKDRVKRFGRVAYTQFVGGLNIARNPVLAFKEVTAVGTYDIAHDIQTIDPNIPIHIVKSHSDEFFESQSMDEKHAEIADRVAYSSIVDPNARHDSALLQSRRTAKLVDNLISR